MRYTIVFLAIVLFLGFVEAECYIDCMGDCGKEKLRERSTHLARKRRHRHQKPEDMVCPDVEPMIIYRDCEDGTM